MNNWYSKVTLLTIGLLLFAIAAYAQQHTVSGTVTDAQTGKPLIGVNILVVGTSTGTATDADGHYSLNVPSLQDSLRFSYIGYKTKTVPIDGRTTINVALKPTIYSGQQMVVVGYGKQKKVNLTGAVESISGKTLQNSPITNLAEGLEGKIANLNVNIVNGSPNTTPSLNIRGGTAFSGNSFQTGSPLILLDGVQINDISQVDPSNIANISVLKDAASAAIYGARAAFGVVLITTKSGKQGQKPQITYNGSMQWDTPTAVPDLLDAATIQKASIEALKLQGQTPPTSALKKLKAIKAFEENPSKAPIYYMSPGGSIIWVGNTDVYDLALRNFTPTQKHNLSLSGGNGKTTYYASLGYLNRQGFYNFNTDKYHRYNVRLNVNSQVTDWLTLKLKSHYNLSKYSEPVSPAGKGGWWTAMAHEPGRNINMPIMTPASSPVGVMYTDNILSFMKYGSRNNENKNLTSFSILPVITPLKNWEIKGRFSFKSNNNRNKEVIPLLKRISSDWDNPATVYTDPSSITRFHNHSNLYTLNATTNYKFSVKKNNFYVLAGFHQQLFKQNAVRAEGQKLLSSNIRSINQTTGNEYAFDSESSWALRGAFYRVTYNYNHKYLLEADGRYQGTSKFPHNSRFHLFKSFSGAWRISQEPFAKKYNNVLSNLKLRVSYGSLGNQDVANYIYIPTYGTISQVEYLFNEKRPLGVTPPGLVSPGITWETATTLDFGINIGLFHKFNITYDWYKRQTSGILVSGNKLPAVLGTAVPEKNSGKLRTLGWDLTASWHNQFHNGFNLNLKLTLSNYNSVITKFHGNPNKLIGNLYQGERMGDIWGYVTVGTFQNRKQIENAPSQKLLEASKWYPGDIQYKDLNGDGKIGPGANTVSDPGDRKIIGNSVPHYKFGLNINASWKNFNLVMFFRGVAKRDYWLGSNLYWGAINGGTGTWNVYNHSWRPNRRDAFFPAYRPKAANVLPQTKYLMNAAYIRLQKVTLGYNIPGRILHIN